MDRAPRNPRSQENSGPLWLELIHGIVPNGGEAVAQAFQKAFFGRTYDPWSKGQDTKYVK
jgi:hypothetical protein